MLQIFKNIPYLGYRRCALLYQPVWPFAAGVTYRTGQGENLPPLLKCAPGRDQRAASTTKTPWLNPLIIRLRRGKFAGWGCAESGNSDTIAPSVSIICIARA